ncbi:hypothetical protein [Paraherbaspirillum soli]|uniref:Uncharacterized protein n=1 Tax=Paraherbaspirillum soli TaxID=631222 RepID=A0ABW0MEB1_9BURK
MQRFLILLLIFLLPMQVFAGTLESQAEKRSMPVQTQQGFAGQLQMAADSGAACDADDEVADASDMQLDLGDDFVPAIPFLFASDSIASTLAPSSDRARQPPFLPLVAPPPRA